MCSTCEPRREKRRVFEQPARIIMNGKGGRIQKKVKVDKQK